MSLTTRKQLERIADPRLVDDMRRAAAPSIMAVDATVFLSHSSRDEEPADGAYNVLRAHGVWR